MTSGPGSAISCLRSFRSGSIVAGDETRSRTLRASSARRSAFFGSPSACAPLSQRRAGRHRDDGRGGAELEVRIGPLTNCQTPALPSRSSWGLPAWIVSATSPARSQRRPLSPASTIASSTSVRSQVWSWSRGPTAAKITSPFSTTIRLERRDVLARRCRARPCRACGPPSRAGVRPTRRRRCRTPCACA